jgi:methionyl aminopeptidase
MTGQRGINLKSERELEIMRKAGRINALALLAALNVVRSGSTTEEIDAAASKILHQHGAEPTFLGYPGPYPYPAKTTISVNEELVHGIPSKRELEEGDIVSIDCGTTLNGYVADSALTVGVGNISTEAQRLIDTTMDALFVGIAQMVVGNKSGDVSSAIQARVEREGFNVVREYTGHGVGRKMHEDPQIPNYGIPHKGVDLKAGMTVALEPMVLAGGMATRVEKDKWTVSSDDGSLTAHYEHTVAITKNGPEILTLLDPDLDGEDAFRYNGYFVGRAELAGK